jgi:hypothetical protein
MAKAFADGQQAAREGKPKYTANPYGGLASECGTFAYPARVPGHALKYSGWIRNEWFWGYEDIVPNVKLPEQEAYDKAIGASSDALREADQEFVSKFWQAQFGGGTYPEATTPEHEAVYAAVERVNKTSAALEEAQRAAGLL